MSDAQVAGEVLADISGAQSDYALVSAQRSRYERLVQQTHRRNFKLGVSNGVLYGFGTYFISKSTVIPSFFSHLTHSSALIGLVSQFEAIGWYLPQLFFATFIVHRAQKMPLYKLAAVVRSICFFALAVVTLLNPKPELLLLFTILAYGLFSMGAGMGGVVFMELLAKAIPAHRRGRFLGLRITLSALLTATLGATTVSALLGAGSFPSNFGQVFLIGAAITTIGLTLMAIMREPRTSGLPAERNVRQQLREGLRILRSDKRYATYVRARLTMATWTVGVPFLVLFGQSHLGFSSGELGIFIAADCAGTVIGNFFWERLSDKKSTKSCLRGAAIVSIILPAVVLMYRFIPLPPLLYAVVFSLSAAVDAGTSIGGLSYLIEISPERDRGTYIGLFNTLMAFPCFLTIGAGLLLDLTGYGVLYSLVLALGIASLWQIRKLEFIPKTLVSAV